MSVYHKPQDKTFLPHYANKLTFKTVLKIKSPSRKNPIVMEPHD